MLTILGGFSVVLPALGLARNLLEIVPGGSGLPLAASSISAESGIPGLPAPASSSHFSVLKNVKGRDPLIVAFSKERRDDDYDPSPVIGQTFSPFDQTKANIYRYRQQQSVNLGSWFVQEKWMVPSLFTYAAGEGASELDIASGWGSTSGARTVLERHWDTFVTQADFDYLASIGINTVRLPIGYWTLGPYFCRDTPFSGVADVYQNSWNRVIRAISMAEQAGIGVLVDLHGAVGSQNGQTHSGVSDGATNLFNDPSSREKTISALVFLTQQLLHVTNAVGIQLLNEPQDVPQLTDFYNQAIESMRQVSPEAASFPLYVHDGFNLDRISQYVANRTDFVVQDHHSYFVYTPYDEAQSASGHTTAIRASIATLLLDASTRQRGNLVVDEWSCALTPSSLAQESDPWKSRKEFGMAQMEVYAELTAGWSFWSYKKEACVDDPGWCFKAAVGNSLPASFFSYRQQRSMDLAQLQSVAARISQMALPSPADILAKLSRKREMTPHQHRLGSIHQRRQGQSAHTWDGSQMSATQRTLVKGYTDGFLTAQTFALHGLSKLGFVGQYVEDSLAALGSGVIEPGTEQRYKDGMRSGVKDGEATIALILQTA